MNFEIIENLNNTKLLELYGDIIEQSTIYISTDAWVRCTYGWKQCCSSSCNYLYGTTCRAAGLGNYVSGWQYTSPGVYAKCVYS